MLRYTLVGLALGLAVQAVPAAEEALEPEGQEKEPRPQAGPNPSPTPTPTPGPRPRRSLHLDLEKHVEKHLEKERQTGMPRFQESVEVEEGTPQAMLERHYEGLHLECGGLEGGAPTEAETRAVRPHVSPSADFLALFKAAGKALGKKKKGDPRFFLYRITRDERVLYEVRPDRVSDALLGQGGVQFELLESFTDLDDAKRALLRMERGFARPLPSSSAPPVPPWATAQPCRQK